MRKKDIGRSAGGWTHTANGLTPLRQRQVPIAEVVELLVLKNQDIKASATAHLIRELPGPCFLFDCQGSQFLEARRGSRGWAISEYLPFAKDSNRHHSLGVESSCVPGGAVDNDTSCVYALHLIPVFFFL